MSDIPCPHCGRSQSKVLDSRQAPNGAIRRRRLCIMCNGRYTTRESLFNPALEEDPEEARASIRKWTVAQLVDAIAMFSDILKNKV